MKGEPSQAGIEKNRRRIRGKAAGLSLAVLSVQERRGGNRGLGKRVIYRQRSGSLKNLDQRKGNQRGERKR